MSHDSITKATDKKSYHDEYSVEDRELFSTRAGSLSSRAKFAIEQRSRPYQVARLTQKEPQNDDGLVIPTIPQKTTTPTKTIKRVTYPKHSPYYKTDNPVGTKSVVMPCMTEKATSSPPLFSPDDEEVAVSSSFTSSFFNSSQYTPSSVMRKK